MKRLLKIMIPLALAAVMVFAMAGVAFAASSNIVIKGQVLNQKGKGLENVTVEASDESGNNQSTTTDADGNYSITITCTLDPGGAATQIQLKATKSGCQPGSKTVGVSTGNVGYPIENQNLTVVTEEKKYALSVLGGSGTGDYEEGEQVQVVADEPPVGTGFNGWTSEGGGSFADAAAKTTTFTMPAEDVIINANQKTLYVPYTLSGKVVDENGKPVEGATTIISSDATEEGASVTVKTGADGTFSANLSLTVGAGGAGISITVNKSGYDGTKTNETVTPSSPTSITIPDIKLTSKGGGNHNGGGDGSGTGGSGSTSGGSGSKSPKTGGEVDTALLLTLMGVAAAGIAASAAALRKRAKSDR